MIEHRTRIEIDRALARQAGVVLTGPRQIGKTTLIQTPKTGPAAVRKVSH